MGELRFPAGKHMMAAFAESGALSKSAANLISGRRRAGRFRQMAGEKKRQKCEGVRSRSGKICGQPLFECGACGATGCQKHDCRLGQFDKHDECKDCGSNRKYPYFGPEETLPASKPPREHPLRINWRWIPVAGVLAAFVAVLAFYVKVWSDPEQFATKAQIEKTPSLAAAPKLVIEPFPSADQSGDPEGLCQCYDQAFKLAGANLSVLSSQYETGFVTCRNLYGVKGSTAWTDGWNARRSAKPFEASCRRYLRQKQ